MLIIENISQLVTCAGGPKKGHAMSDVGIIEHGAVAIEGGRIIAVGTTEDLSIKYPNPDQRIDGDGKAVLPGFVDSHTHFVFGGYRAGEFRMRLENKSYMEIMNEGGGIAASVNMTKETSQEALIEVGLKRLDDMLKMGVTTVEGKSGYGMELDTELKQLEVMKILSSKHPVDVCPTFMGAHSLPKAYKEAHDEKGFLNYLIQEVLPTVKTNDLAEFVDIFCEEGVFSLEGSKYYLEEARKMGFKLKMHADEIVDFGGASLAAELGCQSADHLLKASNEGIMAMAQADVVTTVLPLTAFCLREPFADMKKMMDEGCCVALATDYNPGSCFTHSIPLMIGLACLQMGISIEAVITALTINGAKAIGREASIGSIEVGKKADMIMLEYPYIDFLPYHTGMNIVEWTMKEGVIYGH